MALGLPHLHVSVRKPRNRALPDCGTELHRLWDSRYEVLGPGRDRILTSKRFLLPAHQ